LTVIPGSKAVQEQKTGLPDIALPINFEIDHFDVTRIQISDVPIHSITGSASFAFNRLSIPTLRIEAPQGTAALRAEVQTRGEYPLQVDAKIELKSLTAKPIYMTAALSGNMEQLDLESSIADKVRLTGQFRNLATVPGWSANVHIDDLSPNKWNPDLPPGSLSGELKTQGDLQHAQVTGMLSAIGTELGEMELHLDATGDERSIQLERLDLSHRDIPGKLHASGTINFAGALEYRFDASWRELRWLGAQGNGELDLQGSADRLTAKLTAGFSRSGGESGLATAPIFAHLEVNNIQSKQPRIMLDAKAEQLAYANYKLAGLIAKANVDLADANTSNLEIRANRIEIDEHILRDLLINGTGTTKTHQIDAQVSHDLADLTLGLTGGALEKRWTGSMQQLQLAGETIGQWALLQPAALQISKQKLALEPACLKSSAAGDRICVNGTWEESLGWRFAANTDKLNPDPFLSLWRPDIKWDGDLSLQARLQGGAEPLSGDVKLHSPCCGITLGHNGEQTRTEYRDLSVSAMLSGGNMDAALNAQLPDQGALAVNVKMLGTVAQPWQERQLNANAQLKLNSLRVLQGLSPHFSVQQGSGNMDVALSGTLTNPKLAGKLGIQDLV
ncbi:MAG TPA: hypothetical protein VLA51_11135, partial [Paracoccaceae bacterium]|nr:hypothetical protein [Paracoccaceae bacterium]